MTHAVVIAGAVLLAAVVIAGAVLLAAVVTDAIAVAVKTPQVRPSS